LRQLRRLLLVDLFVPLFLYYRFGLFDPLGRCCPLRLYYQFDRLRLFDLLGLCCRFGLYYLFDRLRLFDPWGRYYLLNLLIR
jgi:hypothetical protein